MLFYQSSKNKQTYLEEVILVFEKIKEIIMDQLDKADSEVTKETRIREDLEADSLDLFQIINDIEDEFDIKIETEEGFSTVGDIVTFVESQQA